MQYFDTNKSVRVGDRILYAGSPGTVVYVIDDDSYSERFTSEQWSYLGKGLGLELEDGTLYHLDTVDEDLEPLLKQGV